MNKADSKNRGTVTALAVLVAVVLLRTLPSESVRDVVWSLVGAAMIFALCYYTLRVLAARLRDNKPDRECLVAARAKNRVFFYLGVVALGLVVVSTGLYFIIKEQSISRDAWTGLSFALFGFGVFYTWFGAFQLKIAGQTIEYWSLEHGHQALNLNDIERARIRIGVKRSRPGIRLEILPRDVAKKPIFVALKAFKKSDMDRVFDWLGPKLEDPGKLALVKDQE